MEVKKSLAERVREFDYKFGEDLLEFGVKALSQPAHEKLRGLLLLSGYKVKYSEVTGEDKTFPFGKRNLYRRATEKGLDIFVELDIKDKVDDNYQNGFSYLSLDTARDYENFQNAYKHKYGRPGIAATGVVSTLGTIGSFLLGITIEPIFLIVSMFGVPFSVIPMAAYRDSKNELPKSIKELQVETNPREAIRKALGLYQLNSDGVEVLEGRAVE